MSQPVDAPRFLSVTVTIKATPEQLRNFAANEGLADEDAAWDRMVERFGPEVFLQVTRRPGSWIANNDVTDIGVSSAR